MLTSNALLRIQSLGLVDFFVLIEKKSLGTSLGALVSQSYVGGRVTDLEEWENEGVNVMGVAQEHEEGQVIIGSDFQSPHLHKSIYTGLKGGEREKVMMR